MEMNESGLLTKIDSLWIKDLNKTPETTKLLEKDRENPP